MVTMTQRFEWERDKGAAVAIFAVERGQYVLMIASYPFPPYDLTLAKLPKLTWCRARMAKAPCEAVSTACYEGTQITGFRYTHLLNPVIQRMSALGHKQT